MAANLQPSAAPAPALSLTSKVGYGLGDLGINLVYASMGTFLMFFYTDVAGLGAAAVGTIMLASRILDGFSDVGMGYLVDRTRSPHGKARPWLLWLAIPFALATVLLFTVPDGSAVLKLIYAVITYNLLMLLFTGINIPYGVLAAMMTQDQYQRSVLSIYRTMFALICALLVAVATLPLVAAFGGGQAGWGWTYGLYGALAAVLFAVTFLTTKETAAATARQDVPFRTGLRALVANKYALLTLLFFVLNFLLVTLFQGTTVYYAQYLLGDAELVAVMSLAIVGPILIGLSMVAPLIRRFGKRNLMIGAAVLTLAGSLVILIDPESLAVVLGGVLLRSLGLAPTAASVWAMLADTMEYGEWKTGVRTEGLIYSAGSLGAKLGIGLGTALLGWLLALGGYVGGAPVQTESAIGAIKTAFIYLPVLVTVLQVVTLLFYRLDSEYGRIMQELGRR